VEGPARNRMRECNFKKNYQRRKKASYLQVLLQNNSVWIEAPDQLYNNKQLNDSLLLVKATGCITKNVWYFIKE
jgi:hypothetical protein